MTATFARRSSLVIKTNFEDWGHYAESAASTRFEISSEQTFAGIKQGTDVRWTHSIQSGSGRREHSYSSRHHHHKSQPAQASEEWRIGVLSHHGGIAGQQDDQ